PLAFAHAMDLCVTTDVTTRKWGLLSGSWTLTDGTGAPDPRGFSIRPKWGPNVLPHAGSALGVISTGIAAAEGDTNPNYGGDPNGTNKNQAAAFPPDWFAANGNKAPSAPGCPVPTGNAANDPVMLTLTIRVPTNARSFS